MKRADILRLIARVRDLVGEAKAAFDNDRDPERAARVRLPLDEAWNLCTDALEHIKPAPQHRGIRP